MKRSFLLPSCLANEKEGDEKEEFFLKNGSLLLEELISLCHGHHNPITTFSAKDLEKATNNYDPSLIFHATAHRKWYTGSLEGRSVSVRKFTQSKPVRNSKQDDAVHEIAMAIKMSNHRGVLKLLGCSLETQIPTLVYEFPTNNLLKDRIRPSGSMHIQPLTWKIRLKIAFEIAHVISYLHTAFPRPIIHRDIKLSHFFLGQNFVPQLSDFSVSVVLPEGETYVTEDHVIGTLGYLAPEYERTLKFTEKIDIYGFGVILLELLTGKRAIRQISDLADALADYVDSTVVEFANRRVKIHGINGIVDPKILEEEGGILELRQFEAVFSLAQWCTKKTADERPTSTEAAKQLQKIQRGFFDEILVSPDSSLHVGLYHSTPSREGMEAAPSLGSSFHLGSYHSTPSREGMEAAPEESLLQPLQTDINYEDPPMSESIYGFHLECF